jgi:transcriptional regulator with XRE-family HTH domain
MFKISERIKAIRESKGYNQVEFAQKLRLSKQTISNYETGARQPGLDIVLNIANTFNISTDYILGRISDQDERDLQFDQFISMCKKDLKQQSVIIKECFYMGMVEVYRILSKGLEYGRKEKLSKFSDIFSKLRVLIFNATELLNKSNNNVNDLLAGTKLFYSEKDDVLKELSDLIVNLTIPEEYNNLPKLSEFEAFADQFNKLSFDEE